MASRTVRVAYFQDQIGLRLEAYDDPAGIVLRKSAALTQTVVPGQYTCAYLDLTSGRYLVYIRNALDQTLAEGVLQHVDAVGNERVDDIDAQLSIIHGSGSWLTGSPTLIVSASAPQLIAINADLTITIHRGDYTVIGLTVGSLVGRTGEKLFFTIREEKPVEYDEDPLDATALLQITETSGALIVKADSLATAADGAIVVTTEATGVIEIRIKSAITTILPIVDSYWYDVQLIRSDGEPITVAEGRLNITADVTRRSTVA